MKRWGVNLPPPPKSHGWCPNMTNDTSLKKLLCSTFRICKKLQIFAKIKFFIAKSSYIVKMLFAKKKLSRKWNIIHFWKALDHAISNMQKISKILNNLIFNQEKLKMCKFPMTGCLQKIWIFFLAKLKQSISLCQRLSEKLNFIKIWQVEVGQNKDLVFYRKKQSFRQCAWRLWQLV